MSGYLNAVKVSSAYYAREVLQRHHGQCASCKFRTQGILLAQGNTRAWVIVDESMATSPLVFFKHECLGFTRGAA